MMSEATSVLGLHLSSRGFGWVLFEDARSVVDWGTVDIRGDKNAMALRRTGSLFDRHRPAILAMEQHDGPGARRSPRIRILYLAVAKSAETRDIAVRLYSRAQIANARPLMGARTRAEVAAAVADCLIVLKPRLPRPRQIWVGERAGMALFCAAACGLTHFDCER